MRPDKKKKQHHDSRKKAEKARQASAPDEVGQDPGTTSGSGIGAKQDSSVEESTPTSRDEKSSKESSKSTKVVEQKPPKNISSNWTKYEIPSSDEDDSEETSTGLNFNFVLENAGFEK